MARMSATLPADLVRDIEKAGYFPALVGDVVTTALAGDEVRHHLVHLETTFDQDEFHRHITVLALTPHKLVIAHADDHADPRTHAHGSGHSAVTATSEAVALSFVRGVTLTHVVADAAEPTSTDSHRQVRARSGPRSRLPQSLR